MNYKGSSSSRYSSHKSTSIKGKPSLVIAKDLSLRMICVQRTANVEKGYFQSASSTDYKNTNPLRKVCIDQPKRPTCYGDNSYKNCYQKMGNYTYNSKP